MHEKKRNPRDRIYFLRGIEFAAHLSHYELGHLTPFADCGEGQTCRIYRRMRDGQSAVKAIGEEIRGEEIRSQAASEETGERKDSMGQGSQEAFAFLRESLAPKEGARREVGRKAPPQKEKREGEGLKAIFETVYEIAKEAIIEESEGEGEGEYTLYCGHTGQRLGFCACSHCNNE